MNRFHLTSISALVSVVVIASCGTDQGSAFDTLPAIYTTTSTSSTTTTTDPRERVYIVQPGDNVSAIARSYEVTAQMIIELNRLPADGEIQPGQELKIPNIRVDLTLPTPSSTVTDETP
jgi:LysM repeat protein